MATKKVAKKATGVSSKRHLNTTHLELHIKREKRPVTERQKAAEQLKPHQFPKGVSGNPGGRPKGSGKIRISDAYAGVMSQDMPDEFKIAIGVDPGEKFTWAEAIALQLLKKSINADSCKPSFKAIQELREVTEGKLPDKSEFGGPGGTPLAPGVGLPVVNVNFKSPTSRPIDGPVPSGVVVVPPAETANVSVDEIKDEPVELNLPEFERGF